MVSTSFTVHWLCERLTESARFIIYALTDPRTGEFKYIGKSARALRRPKEHYTRCDNKEIWKWVQDLRSVDTRYTISVLEEVSNNLLLDAREEWWISLYKSFGVLLNVSPGGSYEADAAAGGRAAALLYQPLSVEERKRRWESRRANGNGKNPKLAEEQKAYWAALSPEERSRIMTERWVKVPAEKRGGRAHTPEGRRAVGESTRKRMLGLSPEERSAYGARAWESFTAEQRSEMARARQQAKTPEKRRETAFKTAASRRRTREARSVQQHCKRCRNVFIAPRGKRRFCTSLCQTNFWRESKRLPRLRINLLPEVSV